MDAKDKTKRYYEIIRKNIKKIRLEKNISKEELLLRINASDDYINRVESLKINPSLKYLFRICNELDIGMKELLKEEK